MKVVSKSLSRCSSIQRVSAALLLFFLASSSSHLAAAEKNKSQNGAQLVLQLPDIEDISEQNPTDSEFHRFTLRHVVHHGAYLYPSLHRKRDVKPNETLIVLSDNGSTESIVEFTGRSRISEIQRLKDRRPSTVEPMLAAAREFGHVQQSSSSAWVIDRISSPNITDKNTVLNLAIMAANAYVFNESSSDWEDLDRGFNRSQNFGWERDGLRGHIYADENNSTVIIGIKGTSAAFFDGNGTSTNDKWNDNLFASCCCGQQGAFTWVQVCDCATSTFTCNRTCVVKALRNESRYYTAARNLYSNVTLLYPNSNVWVVGHSLGGAVSSLLGLTYGLPTVTFQAVPEALAAARLGLPQPSNSVPGAHQTRSMTGAYHFGHTADPIYMGSCNNWYSACSLSGYAFESQCHSGQRCVYDVVADKGWSVSLDSHRIRNVIEYVIKDYETVPKCAPDYECVDCYNWKYYDSNTTQTSISSKSTTTSQTSTCKTPGWWDCLDTSTTTTTTTSSFSTTSSETSTATTTTCETPGWFGRCLDETTTTSSPPTPATFYPTTISQTTNPRQNSVTSSSNPYPH